jgi:hypothetical protein
MAGVFMRWGALLLLLLAAGCASNRAPQVVAQATPELPYNPAVYDDAVAAALVYDPPVVVDAPRVDVSREGRSASAYAGFEELTTTYYYLRIDDRQLDYGGGSHHDRFEREAITQRVGVSYR